MPVGRSLLTQQLVRVVRTGETTYEREELGGVAFVPLIGAEGWPNKTWQRLPAPRGDTDETASASI